MSDSILSDQDWIRTVKFHSPLISGTLAILAAMYTYLVANLGLRKIALPFSAPVQLATVG